MYYKIDESLLSYHFSWNVSWIGSRLYVLILRDKAWLVWRVHDILDFNHVEKCKERSPREYLIWAYRSIVIIQWKKNSIEIGKKKRKRNFRSWKRLCFLFLDKYIVNLYLFLHTLDYRFDLNLYSISSFIILFYFTIFKIISFNSCNILEFQKNW